MKPGIIMTVIAEGRAATRMPGFGEQLSKEEIAALAGFIQQPLPAVPSWEMTDIQATHVVSHPPATLPDRPVFDAVTFEEITRLPMRKPSGKYKSGTSIQLL